MCPKATDLSGYVREYRALFTCISHSRSDRTAYWNQVVDLVQQAGWSRLAALILVQCVQMYGSFVLKNAAAIAIALNFEDGLVNDERIRLERSDAGEARSIAEHYERVIASIEKQMMRQSGRHCLRLRRLVPKGPRDE